MILGSRSVPSCVLSREDVCTDINATNSSCEERIRITYVIDPALQGVTIPLFYVLWWHQCLINDFKKLHGTNLNAKCIICVTHVTRVYLSSSQTSTITIERVMKDVPKRAIKYEGFVLVKERRPWISPRSIQLPGSDKEKLNEGWEKVMAAAKEKFF
ncbi:PREDICTED: uncharacterized protein LOC101296155 [Fragaria vesca subsp. vesca]